jgi:drug/metabolite transporter (DMT)-like permease
MLPRPAFNSRAGGVLLVALSASCFAAMPIFARAMYADGGDPSTLLLLRFALAAAILLPLAARRAATARPGRATRGGLALLGAVYVGQSLTYFVALTSTSVALLGLLLYLYPVAVAVLASVLFRIPLTRARVVSLALALIGAGLTIGPLGGGGGNWLGIGLGLASALIYSGYILLATRVTRSVDPLWSSAIITASAASIFGVLALIHGVALPASGAGWAAVVAIAVVSTVVAILSFVAGLQRIGPTDAATLSTLEPAITALLAVVVLGESLGQLQVIGGALIVSAALVVTRQPQATSFKTATWPPSPGARVESAASAAKTDQA